MADQDTPNLRAPLKIHLQGPAVRHHRMALQDFILFARQIQTAVDRVARVLRGQGISVRPGRKPSNIKNTCSLDIVEIKGGSLTIICDLPVEGQPEMFEDLGEEALAAFVEGIEAVGGQQSTLPKGYEKGVLLALRESGKLFDRGIETITFDLRTRKGHRSSRYTQEVRARIVERIQAPIESRQTIRTVEGRLLMGDFKTAGFRCRIHPPIGRSIPCTFDEAHKKAVLGALTHYVRLVGEATEAKDEILSLKIVDIEVLDRDAEAEGRGEERRTAFFEGRTDIEVLATQQGVSAVREFDKLLGDFWPEEESADQFIGTVREWRREGERREG
jgi:hypothetical protein